MFLNQVLNNAEQIEQGLAECYELMSQMTDQNDLSASLKTLAQEEISHRNAVKAGKNYLYQAPDEFGSERIPAEELREGLDQIQKFKQTLIDKTMDLPSALETMLSLEKAYEKVHLSTLIEIQDPRLKSLFQALCNYDKAHRKRLEDIIAKLAAADTIK